MSDPGIVDVIKPLVRVVLEFEDGSAIQVTEGNIQREELFRVHAKYGLVALSLAVSTESWQPTSAADVLIHATPIQENRSHGPRPIIHDPASSGFSSTGGSESDKQKDG